MADFRAFLLRGKISVLTIHVPDDIVREREDEYRFSGKSLKHLAELVLIYGRDVEGDKWGYWTGARRLGFSDIIEIKCVDGDKFFVVGSEGNPERHCLTEIDPKTPLIQLLTATGDFDFAKK